MSALSAPEAQLAAAIGWSLLHVLWQGVFVGVVLAIALRAMRNSPPTVRYALCSGALAAVALCPLLTLAGIKLAAGHSAARALLYVPLAAGKGSMLSNVGGSTGRGLLDFVRIVQTWLPVVLLVWILGTGLKMVRIMAGLVRSRRLRLSSHVCITGPLSEMVGRLAGALGISRDVPVLISPNTDIPIVAGWRKPTVLVPPSFLEKLSLQEMETIIVHELAHIQRRDYPVNVAQAGVEALFFYHPVVWWISRQIRREREHCCDDIALRVSGSPLVCAKALTALEEHRSAAVPSLSPAASRGDLTMRIRRILDPKLNKPLRRGMAISVVTLSLCTTALLAALSLAVAGMTSPLMAEASTSSPVGSSSKHGFPLPPNMDCTYYKRVAPGRAEPHPGYCVDTGSDTGTFYCRQIDEDQQEQEQRACQSKVQRLHQWQKQLKRDKDK